MFRDIVRKEIDRAIARRRRPRLAAPFAFDGPMPRPLPRSQPRRFCQFICLIANGAPAIPVTRRSSDPFRGNS